MPAYALITGGSQGLGKAFAEKLAQRGVSLILVALPDKNLTNTAQTLQKQYPNITVYTIGIDLTEPQASQKIIQFIAQHQISIGYLINNAGIGYTDKIENLSAEFVEKLLKINIMALTQLTHSLIPLLKANAPSYILNIASMAGLFTMPYKTIYSASKHYVVQFSLALREELKKYGIQVSVVCPGGMSTNAEVAQRIASMGKIGKILTATPELVAEVSIRAMLKGKAIIIPKWQIRWYSYLRILPTIWQAKIIGKTLQKRLL